MGLPPEPGVENTFNSVLHNLQFQESLAVPLRRRTIICGAPPEGRYVTSGSDSLAADKPSWLGSRSSSKR